MDEDERHKQVVKDSYDKIATTYLSWTSEIPSPRVAFLEKLFAVTPSGPDSVALELGCGAGVPGTKTLAEHYGRVVANDISDAQITLAKENLASHGNVQFVAGDMTKLTFEPASLDAVVAFYSIIHLPRPDQVYMFKQILAWLKPRGWLLCNLGTTDNPGRTVSWLEGTQMYWSGFNADEYLGLLKECGFVKIESQILEDDENGRMVPFLWILAAKE